MEDIRYFKADNGDIGVAVKHNGEGKPPTVTFVAIKDDRPTRLSLDGIMAAELGAWLINHTDWS